MPGYIARTKKREREAYDRAMETVNRGKYASVSSCVVDNEERNIIDVYHQRLNPKKTSRPYTVPELSRMVEMKRKKLSYDTIGKNLGRGGEAIRKHIASLIDLGITGIGNKKKPKLQSLISEKEREIISHYWQKLNKRNTIYNVHNPIKEEELIKMVELKREGVINEQIAKITKRSYSTIDKHMGNLEDMGLIITKQEVSA